MSTPIARADLPDGAPGPALAWPDRLAARLLSGPLVAGLALLGLSQVVQWAPHYLTWPFFPDHDVFATAARAWDAGSLPYRDYRTNNFPGTIYLFWALGRVAGWGNATAFYAVDAAWLLAFLGLLIAWSRRVLGSTLSGLVAGLSWLGVYLDYDYSLTAQRDWHAGSLAVAAILAVQAWPGRSSRIASALLLAVALSIRPQVVLFGPAWWLALGESEQATGLRPLFRGRLGPALALAGFAALMFAPLMIAGVLGDFVESLRLVAYGGEYSRTSPGTFREELQKEVLLLRLWVVAGPAWLLACRSGGGLARTTRTWASAFLAVLMYKPVSPVPHAYLIQPLFLVWTVHVALVVRLLVEAVPAGAPLLRLTAVLLVLGLQATGRPRMCNVEHSKGAAASLARGEAPAKEPLGHALSPWAQRTAAYSWADQRATLAYLRGLPAGTRVANVLRGYPALASGSGRLSALPAESVAWLMLIRKEDEAAFARSLEAHGDSVVVWSPPEVGRSPRFLLTTLEPTIRRLYRPAARFGKIEVWARRPEGEAALAARGHAE